MTFRQLSHMSTMRRYSSPELSGGSASVTTLVWAMVELEEITLTSILSESFAHWYLSAGKSGMENIIAKG